MLFPAANGTRPIRLSENTRRFAFDSLNYKYGTDTKKCLDVKMDYRDDFNSLSDIHKYNLIIKKIATDSPIRICEGEKISGAATLGMAIDHYVPATFQGKPVFGSISHLTIDFETVLKKGINSIIEDIRQSLESHTGQDEKSFLNSALCCAGYMKMWHERYLAELKDKRGYEKNFKNLLNVPFNPAKTFYEAVQSLWFTFSFVRLCGNWPGIGRIDWLLGDFLKRDLESGTITLDEAREILAHFFIKGCEWVCGGDYGSGDAQHYQNIVLGGVDENGVEITNEVTYLVLDIIEELGISDFPTTVRINKNTDEKLLRRISDVISYGGGIIAVYGEDTVIDALTNYGYSTKDARRFANDGCWEVQIPGETFFTYCPFDALHILQHTTLNKYSNVKFDTYEDLYQAYIQDLFARVEQIKDSQRDGSVFPKGKNSEWKWKPNVPCTVISLFEKGCIDKGRSYLEGGPIYNVISPHIGGIVDVVNSLYAIKKLVFDDKLISFEALMEALLGNWDNDEELRKKAEKYLYFGNDNDEVDSIAARLVNDFAIACDSSKDKYPHMMPAGISTFGRQIEWASSRLATAYGKKSNAVLSANYSPTPSTDKNGATSIIKSHCKADFKRIVSGAALDIKLSPATVNSSNGHDAIISLIKGFVDLGGFFMQLDVADKSLLLEAQEHPENHTTLSVRVSGWNARFITLNKEWQNMIIDQYNN